MRRILFLFFLLVLTPCASLFGQEIEKNLTVRKEVPYERFVGLGNCCISRFQINNHLSKRFGKPANDFGGGQLFDWLVIHDYDKFCEVLENNLVDLMEKSDLVPTASWDNVYIKNIKYQITWNHLFTRLMPNFTPEGHAAVQTVLDNEYEVKKQKIDYLIKKFKELGRYRTLYIIGYPFIDTGRFNTIEPTIQTLTRLSHALEKIRGNKNFMILYCPLQKKFDDFDNIVIKEIVSGPSVTDYEGDYECWGAILNTFPFYVEKSDSDTQTWADQMDW